MSALARMKLFNLMMFQQGPHREPKRPWEIKEADFNDSRPTKSGRKLPLIPGTPQWHQFQFAKDKIAVRSELKEILAKRRSLIEQEEKLLGGN